jgi:hypothetical protein
MADHPISQDDLPCTRAEARKLGIKRYFTGKPCKHGHVAYRLSSSTSCSECLRLRYDPRRAYENTKEWRARHPQSRREEARRYRAKYPDKVRSTAHRFRERHGERLRPIEAEQARERRRNDPEGNRRRLRAFKERREQKLADIAGRPRPEVCDLCKANNGGIVFDHCHAGGHFRGWLCDRCNKVLGLVRDSRSLLRRMVRYLEDSDGKVNDVTQEEPSDFELLGSG